MSGSRTKVTNQPPADFFAGKGETIIEFFNKDVQGGGLISFYSTGDHLYVRAYRLDPKITVMVSDDQGPEVN